MIITISGQAGSGKSTVAGILSRKLGFKRYSVGDMRRKMAAERGMTIAELNKLGETHDFTDREVDEFQRKLGETEDNFIIDGRTSWYFIPHSVKVYLDAELAARAGRVFKDERSAEDFRTPKDAEKALVEREKSDRLRYRKYYGIDVFDRKHYDIVIDTTHITAAQAAERVLEYIRKHKSTKALTSS